MKIVFMSLTGNVKKFVERTGLESYEISDANPYIEVDGDFLVVIPTYVGYINDTVSDFLEYKNNLAGLVGFVASGNRNFDDLYCINAKELSEKYGKPMLMDFEYFGTDHDLEKFRKVVKEIETDKNNI